MLTVRLHFSPKNYENDIAIWELAEPIEMNEYVAAVALPEMMQDSTGECTVSGWGTLHSGRSLDHTFNIQVYFEMARQFPQPGGSCCPMKLMKVDVPVVTDETCRIEYPFMIADSMLCAGEHGTELSTPVPQHRSHATHVRQGQLPGRLRRPHGLLQR